MALKYVNSYLKCFIAYVSISYSKPSGGEITYFLWLPSFLLTQLLCNRGANRRGHRPADSNGIQSHMTKQTQTKNSTPFPFFCFPFSSASARGRRFDILLLFFPPAVLKCCRAQLRRMNGICWGVTVYCLCQAFTEPCLLRCVCALARLGVCVSSSVWVMTSEFKQGGAEK